MKILYVYDALCGWCYGFSDVISRFHEKYNSSLDFEVISGGMVVGGRVGEIGKVASYISSAYKDVERISGVKFGSKFLDSTLKDGKTIFTSTPPAIAMSIFKEINKNKQVQFACELQKAIYFEGLAPKNLETYVHVVSIFGIDAQSFVLKMKNQRYKLLAEKDFRLTATLGLSGFPSVLLKLDGTYFIIGTGYLSFNQLEQNYLAIKKTII